MDQCNERSTKLGRSQFVWITLSVLVACGASPPPLLPDVVPAPLEIRKACAQTERQCTRCHSLERVVQADARTYAEWERYVTRMRLLPSSGISPADAEVILRCLEYRSAALGAETRIRPDRGSSWSSLPQGGYAPMWPTVAP